MNDMYYDKLSWVLQSINTPLVFYVGQADNLREQLLGHLSDLDPNVCIRRHVQSYTCYFGFASLAKKADRDGAERALYEHFAHECNTAVLQGPVADINFS